MRSAPIRFRKSKREEFEDAARLNALIVLEGDFASAATTGVAIRLVRFEPSAPSYAQDDAAVLDMPPDLGLEVVLPDDAAITPTGRERIERGQPLYGRVIAHSPSFDSTSGTLTCSAYAVWGLTRAARWR